MLKLLTLCVPKVLNISHIPSNQLLMILLLIIVFFLNVDLGYMTQIKWVILPKFTRI